MDYSFISEVQQIQNGVEKLKEKFGDQTAVKLVLDGLIVSSLGKLFAMEVHDVELFNGLGIHHGKTKDGKLIRITTTQGNNIILKNGTDQLLVLRLNKNGGFPNCIFREWRKGME